MARRQFLLTLSLALALIVAPGGAAGAQLLPPAVRVIVQIAPTSSITTIAGVLGGTLIDSIPGANTYLLNLPAIPSGPITSLLGIQCAELNTGVSIPSFGVLNLVTVPATAAPDWYKYQPSWQLIEAQNALRYSTGRGVVVADINSQVDYSHPALRGHLTSGYDFVTSKPSGATALNQSSASYLDQSSASYLDQSSASYLDQSSASYLDQSSASYLDGLNPA